MMFNKKSIIFYMLIIFYRITLDLIYLKLVHPVYWYTKFGLDVNLIKLSISYLLTIILMFIIPKSNKKVSNLVLQLHFILMIIPMYSYYSLSNQDSKYIFMVTFVFTLQLLLIKFIKVKFRKTKKIINKKIFFNAALLFSLMVYSYVIFNYNINFSVLDLLSSTIYDVREDLVIGSFFSYFINWQFRIINPILLVYFVYVNNKKFAVIVILLQVLLYLYVPRKEIFLSIFLILLVFILMRKKYNFKNTFAFFISLGNLFSAFIYLLFNNSLMFAIFSTRLIYIPARNKFQHYDFFSQNKKLYFSEGLIGKIFGLDYPYSVSTGEVISGGNGNANAGYLAYSFNDAGFFGMILMVVVLTVTLLFIDSKIKDKNNKYIFAIIVYPMIVLNDGPLLSMFLTGGFFIFILVLLVFDLFNNGESEIAKI